MTRTVGRMRRSRDVSHWCAGVLLAAAALPVSAQPAEGVHAQIDRGDYAAAQRSLEQRLATAPDDAAAQFLLARVHAWRGEPAAALPVYRALIEREPGNADYRLGYGQALLWAGQPAAAVDALERAQALAPRYADVDSALAQARAARDRAQAAARDTQRDAATAAPPASSDAARASGQDAPGATAPATAPATPTLTLTPATAPPSASVAPAMPPPDRSTRRRSVALTARIDRLDRGLEDWRAQRLDVVATERGRPGVFGALVSERRFGLSDRGVELGAVLPFGESWTFVPQLAAATDAQFLPRRALDLRLERAAGAWVGAASLRRSGYADARVDRLALGVERYVAQWRGAYTLNLTRVDGRSALGHDLRLARRYAERADGHASEIGVQFVFGREDAVIGTQVLTSDVRALSLGGRHGLAPEWSLLWALGTVRQGTLYTRDGVTLGLERRF